MLKWKRVDTLILSVADLSKRGFAINLTLVGDGPEINKLKKLAKKLLNPSEYLFCNSINPDTIPQLMFNHDIFVLPSSAYEGWGFVINEAMNSECAIIASQSAGAAAAMIKHNVNGLLFKSGNWHELSSNIELLIKDKELRYYLINNARITIQNKWSSNCAAKRFVSVVNALLNNKNIPLYEDGPMSKT
jgi:glycosyltransferase involved in cell wall biosynthesis